MDRIIPFPGQPVDKPIGITGRPQFVAHTGATNTRNLGNMFFNFNSDENNLSERIQDRNILCSSDEAVEGDEDVIEYSKREPEDNDIEMEKVFNSITPARVEEQGKRDWESGFAPVNSRVNLSGYRDHNNKRARTELNTKSSQIQYTELQKPYEGPGGETQPHNLFCWADTLAAAPQADSPTGAFQVTQEEDPHISELDAFDLGLLGGNCITRPTPLSDDQGIMTTSLLNPNHGCSNVFTLESSYLQATLRRIYGLVAYTHTEGLFIVDSMPRKAGFSDQCTVRREWMIDNGYQGKLKKFPKGIGPSKKFRSFFGTRRLRKNLIRRAMVSWDRKDALFVLSGQIIEDPPPGLGTEMMAKCLLDVSRNIFPTELD